MPRDSYIALRNAEELFAPKRDTGLKAELASSKASTIAKMGQLRALRIARDGEQSSAAPIEVTPENAANRD